MLEFGRFRGSLKEQALMMKKLLLTMGVLAVGSLGLRADVDVSKLPPASTQKPVTFAKDIKPIFEKSCLKCHGEEKQKGDLRLDTIEAVKKGSEHGPVVVVGNSAKSSLVHSVAGLIEDGLMPPKGDPLTKEQIGLIRAWIDQGAK